MEAKGLIIAQSFALSCFKKSCKILYTSVPSFPISRQVETGPGNDEFVEDEALKHSEATSRRPFFHYENYGSPYPPKPQTRNALKNILFRNEGKNYTQSLYLKV